MTDIVEGLRKVESSTQNMSNSVTTNWYRNPDGPEAADEIERLRAENDNLFAVQADLVGELAALREENADLLVRVRTLERCAEKDARAIRKLMEKLGL